MVGYQVNHHSESVTVVSEDPMTAVDYYPVGVYLAPVLFRSFFRYIHIIAS